MPRVTVAMADNQGPGSCRCRCYTIKNPPYSMTISIDKGNATIAFEELWYLTLSASEHRITPHVTQHLGFCGLLRKTTHHPNSVGNRNLFFPLHDDYANKTECLLNLKTRPQHFRTASHAAFFERHFNFLGSQNNCGITRTIIVKCLGFTDISADLFKTFNEWQKLY